MKRSKGDGNISTPRTDALTIWNAGVDSVRGRELLQAQVSLDVSDPDGLFIGDHVVHRADFDRVLVIGAGKATAAMTAGLCDKIAGWLPIEGWINVPPSNAAAWSLEPRLYENDLGSIPQSVRVHEARPVGVNEPRPEGVYGTEQILGLVQNAKPRDLCIALLSGGGSALLTAPCRGITLDDKLAVIRRLSESGAGIVELNTVRKHLSRVKGGGLLRYCRAGELVTLVLSDVLGDPIDLIASGPTVEDSSSQEDAIEILKHFDPGLELPAAIYRVLGNKPETPQAITTHATTIIIGNNAVAVDEAGIVAESLGYNHIMHSQTKSEGTAEDVGRHHADMLVGMLHDRNTHRANCFVTGGEPVVTLAPPAVRGLGGRNQQLALAAYKRLIEYSLSEAEWEKIVILSGGTDGEDGPTDAAGAIVDYDVHRIAVEKKFDVDDYLIRNDAYHFFEQTGGLLKTGATGTNVCDIRVGLIDCKHQSPD
ncbi:putative hydroxypyruvate reductase [Novipirellula aureliae]|uniref:Putative hydroxypyruvate reductase n=1 Tax=Novipirellula aureliae TaxID=2527966 RepID=A0A5C6DYZ9_9BACT|nr:DUF4147 domain-containing protein [Novipirellula aureliae]TWU41665.1 putative hydroxypyruvate reductase [Novipirellula aureliae]